jgi:enoyl-CoA hydratase/carnithine racemase
MNGLLYSNVEDRGHVRIVTINRPEVANALNREASHELEAVWNEFAANDDLWVGIITGSGDRAFSAGNDLKAQAAGKRGPRPHTGFGGLAMRTDLTKPVIAAVNGLALGGGFEMALACDLIIASENAYFGLPEGKVGMMAAGGGVQRLPRIIPQKEALGIILTGRRVTPEEGRKLGFVNEIVPAGKALEGAMAWADKILELAPIAVRAAKEAVYASLDKPTLEDAIRATYPIHSTLTSTEDFIEGPKAFAEKRKPVWKNR